MTFIIERELVSEQIYQVETVFANQGAVMLLVGGIGGPPRFVKKISSNSIPICEIHTS